MGDLRPKSPLMIRADDVAHTIVMPLFNNISDQNYERQCRDIGRIQWLAKGYGGAPSADNTLTFSFEPEEYNCALRYLLKFEWKREENA